MREGEADFIQAMEEARFHGWVDLEMKCHLFWEVQRDALVVQVDGGLKPAEAIHALEDLLDLGFGELDGAHACGRLLDGYLQCVML